MVTEAILKYSNVKSIGLCNAPIGLIKQTSAKYGVEADRIYAEFVGLNHLHWITRIDVNGEDKLDDMLADTAGYSAKNVPAREWNPEFLQSLHALPSYYLKYFYMTDAMLEEQLESLQTGGNRAEVVKRVEEELFELYNDPDLKDKPKQLEQRGGAFYSEAAVNLMRSLYNGTNDIQTLNVANQGIIDFLPDDASIEVNCVVTKTGPLPLPLTKVPPMAVGLIHAVKTYERLAIDAAVTGDRGLAIQALAHHPLVPSVEVAIQMLDEMLEANKEYLPQFFTESAANA
jgi:6-phospho-beta-glucosidase